MTPASPAVTKLNFASVRDVKAKEMAAVCAQIVDECKGNDTLGDRQRVSRLGFKFRARAQRSGYWTTAELVNTDSPPEATIRLFGEIKDCQLGPYADAVDVCLKRFPTAGSKT